MAVFFGYLVMWGGGRKRDLVSMLRGKEDLPCIGGVSLKQGMTGSWVVQELGRRCWMTFLSPNNFKDHKSAVPPHDCIRHSPIMPLGSVTQACWPLHHLRISS